MRVFQAAAKRSGDQSPSGQADHIGSSTMDIHQQFGLLEEFTNFQSPKTRWKAYERFLNATFGRRLLKAGILLLAAVVMGWAPIMRLFTITSAEATVNSTVITLRAPIDGSIVSWQSNSAPGSALNSGQTVLRIENPRADRSRLDELKRSQAQVVEQRRTFTDRMKELGRLRSVQLGQFEAFRQARVAQLEARRNEIIAEQDAAKARIELAEATLNRSSSLYTLGIQTQKGQDESIREHKVMIASLAALARRLEAAEIELESARQGIFVADGFNDVPRSSQRADEIALQIAELKVAIEDCDRKLQRLDRERDQEEQLFESRSVAVVKNPATGQVWELLTSVGEEVHHGQPLLRVLDCKAAMVTAAVSEANFNKLHIGGEAKFRMRGQSEQLAGRVVGLFGLAAAPANLAINHASLAREPFHVSIEVPALSSSETCQIGKTGIVTFD